MHLLSMYLQAKGPPSRLFKRGGPGDFTPGDASRIAAALDVDDGAQASSGSSVVASSRVTFKRPDRFSDAGGGLRKASGPSAWAEDIDDDPPAAAATQAQREFKRPGGFVDPGAEAGGWASSPSAAPAPGLKAAALPPQQRHFKRAGGFEEGNGEDSNKPSAPKPALKPPPPPTHMPQRGFLRGNGVGDESEFDEDAVPRPEVGPAPADLPASRAARRQAMRDFKRRNQALDGDEDDDDIDVEGGLDMVGWPALKCP